MGIVWSVIEEERDRLEQLIDHYTKKINQYPKGYLTKKIRGRQTYIYRNYREGKSIKSIYIGVKGSRAVSKAEKENQDRAKYEDLIKITKEKLKETNRALGRRKH